MDSNIIKILQFFKGYSGDINDDLFSAPSPGGGGGGKDADGQIVTGPSSGYAPGVGWYGSSGSGSGGGGGGAAKTPDPSFEENSYNSPYTDENKYEYKPYDANTDAAYQSALSKLNEVEKPTYTGTYDAQLQSIYEDILGREKFHYDLNSDELYRQYRDQYTLQGKQAMMDTMGQAASLTGGYGSSYAQAVGQQQYNNQLQTLNNIVPELYDRAYQEYKDDQDWKLQAYSLTKDMADTEYGRYRDSYSDFMNDRNYYTDRADTIYNQNYKAWTDDQSMRKQLSDTEYAKLAAEAEQMALYGDFSGYAAMFGKDIAQNMFRAWKYQNPDVAKKLGYAV